MPLTFSLFPYRFTFRARDSVQFPAGKAGNTFRGAFGHVFRRIACTPDCPGVSACEIREICPYARLFEPTGDPNGPSGLADSPRPFVFRAAHLDGCALSPQTTFHIDVHVFDLREPALAWFTLAFAQLARDGLGPRRGRVDLVSVDALDAAANPARRLFDGDRLTLAEPPPPLVLSLDPDPAPVTRVRVRFLTPTEIKAAGRLVETPEFAALFARARDRVSTLCYLYGGGALPIDFRAQAARAAAVRTLRSDLNHASVLRRSSRTGQVHPIAGFTGEIDYEGPLAEFLPYLRAAAWTGLGRHTVWGQGAVALGVSPLPKEREREMEDDALQ